MMSLRHILLLSLLMVGLCSTGVRAADPVANTVGLNSLSTSHEDILINALEQVRKGELDAALGSVRVLVEAYPNYRLAQLMYADLLLAKSQPLREFGNFQSAPHERITALLEEARTRWQYHRSPPPVTSRLPTALARMSDSQTHAVVVDMSLSRLYIFRNDQGTPRLIHDFYTTIGKNGTGKLVEGDQRTPVGVYFVTGAIEGEKLPDLYGIGAFPIDYPNAWDQRHGRTGYGIWLHGTPSNTLNRPPRDSDGCVILSNSDLDTISPYLPEETPVILAEQLEWVDEDDWRNRQDRYAEVVEQWRRDWESTSPDRYLGHYSTNYSGLGMDYQSWVDYKTRINTSRDYIRVGLTDRSIFEYPGEPGMIVVTFNQHYESEGIVRDARKRQYWRMEKDGRWRIVYEGSAS